MDAQLEAVALLTLATRKGLIAQQSAATIKVQIESGVHLPGAKPVAELLVKEGHITAPQAELLLSEFTKAQGPKVIGGHQLVSKLGQGGMGAVFKAIQLSMQREVALKLLNPALAKDKEFVERFVREARAAGKVVHANVIACYDVGVDNGTPFMSLELVPGGDALRKANAAGGKLPEREGVAIIRDAALGLAAIGKAGLIHRDIKPANIFLTEDGRAKLADLGLARSSAGDDRMTQTGAAVGSPAYMSPEQAKGAHDLDIRTDVYSLGASLYHLLVGHPPYSASSVFATVAKVINDPVPDPRAANPSISPAAAALIKKSMSKDRTLRQQTPEDLVEELEAVLAGKHPAGRSAPLHAAPVHAHAHPRRHAAADAKPGSNLGLYLGIGGAAVVVLVVAAMLLGGRDRPAPPATGPVGPPVATAATPTPPAVATAPVRQQPSVSATPAPPPPSEHPLRDRIREIRQERIEARNEASVSAPVAAPVPVAVEAAPVASAGLPEWAPQAGAVLDAVYDGKLSVAATAAKDLPKEYQDAVAQLQRARVDLPKVYKAQSGAIVAAKPQLKAMPNIPDLAVTEATDKGLRVANPAGMGTLVLYDRLTVEDTATLRDVLVKSSLEPWQSRTLMQCGISSGEALANADGKDAAIASLQRLAKIRSDQLAEEKAAKEAADRAKAAVTSADLTQVDERTRRVIRNVAEVTSLSPIILSGVIDRPVELRDFTVIRKDVTLVGNGRLIPTAGAVVFNGAENVGYEPTRVQGLPFISFCISPYQTAGEGAAERGAAFTNCIFYGRALIDSQSSPNFVGCTFIGGIGNDAGSNRILVTSPVQRPRQIRHSDFFRVRFVGNLPVADSEQCWFGQCEMEDSVFMARQPVSVPAWDAGGAMRAILERNPARTVTLMPLEGRPQSVFGHDTPVLARYLDGTAAVVVAQLKEALSR